MITCARCESTYEDDASYCNVCKTPIALDNSHYMVDQKRLNLALQAQAQRTKNFIYVLSALIVIFPFFSLTRYFPTYIYGGQKAVWVSLIIAFGIAAIVGFKTKQNWSYLPCLILVGLLLPIIPAGTLCGGLVLFFWFRQKN